MEGQMMSMKKRTWVLGNREEMETMWLEVLGSNGHFSVGSGGCEQGRRQVS